MQRRGQAARPAPTTTTRSFGPGTVRISGYFLRNGCHSVRSVHTAAMFASAARTGSSSRSSSSSSRADATRSLIVSSIHCTAPVVTINVRQRSMAMSSRFAGVHQLGQLPAGGRVGQVVCGDHHAGGLAFDEILAARACRSPPRRRIPPASRRAAGTLRRPLRRSGPGPTSVRSLQPLIAAPISNGRRTV